MTLIESIIIFSKKKNWKKNVTLDPRHGTLALDMEPSTLDPRQKDRLPIVWNMCENLHYESVYFKEPDNQQEYYKPTIYRTGAAVACSRLRDGGGKSFSNKKCEKRAGLGRDIFPAATAPFPKSCASYFRFTRFNTFPLYYLRAWHRLGQL